MDLISDPRQSNITVSAPDLYKALASCRLILGTQGTCKIETKAGSLFVVAFSEEMTIEAHAGPAEGSLSVVVNCDKLMGFIKDNKGSADLAYDTPSRMTVTQRIAGSSGKPTKVVSQLTASKGADYQNAPSWKKETSDRVQSQALYSLLNAASHAMHLDVTRNEIKGIYLSTLHETEVVSTDGYRMYLQRPGSFLSMLDLKGALIPSESVKALLDILKRLNEEVTVRIGYLGRDATFFCVETANSRIVCRFSDTKYPDYNALLKGLKFPHSMKVFRSELFRALSTVCMVHNVTCVTLNVREKELVLRAKTDIEEIEFLLPCEYTNTPQEPIYVNPRYLLDAVVSLPGDEILIQFGAPPLDPIRVSSVGDDRAFEVIQLIKP